MNGISDGQRFLNWDDIRAQVDSEREHNGELQYPEGENSTEFAIELLAAGAGIYPAVPINSRWRDEEKAGWKAGFAGSKLNAGIYVATSGSSGIPKAAYLTPESLTHHAQSVCAHLSVTSGDTWLLCLPLFHVGGMSILFRCREAGANVRILNRGDAEAIHQVLDNEHVTLLSLVSTTLRKLLEHRGGNPFPDYLRAIIVGGGPVGDDLLELCPIALQTYGLTEAGSMLTCVPPGASLTERLSAGRPLPGVNLWIEREDGTRANANESGMICAATPGMFSGYYDVKTKSVISPSEKFLRTGDYGFLDESGCLHIESRREDLIVSGGENIAPAEIERVICAHPGVSECIVTAIADEIWGQVPAVLIVRKENSRLDEDELLHFLQDRLSNFKRPKRIVFAEEIPQLATGKADRQRIREMLTRS